MKGIKITIYDWLGYLVPGSLVVWAFVELSHLFDVNLSASVLFTLPATAQVIFLLILCYAVGHMLHALANLTIDKHTAPGFAPSGYFPNQFDKHFPGVLGEKIRRNIARYFEMREDEPDLINNCYWTCYCLVASSNPESLVHTFLGLTGFYRGMSMACFLVAFVYFSIGVSTKVWLHDLDVMGLALMWVIVIIVIVSALLGWLFLNRVARFRSYLARAVLAEFLSVCDHQPLIASENKKEVNE
jgi:hypothetical protein